jgi:hypothetical protein
VTSSARAPHLRFDLLEWQHGSRGPAFVFSGSAHTSLQGSAFYTRTAGGATTGTGGVVLNDWVRDLLNRTVTNVGP